jgi:hypothetical protein
MSANSHHLSLNFDGMYNVQMPKRNESHGSGPDQYSYPNPAYPKLSDHGWIYSRYNVLGKRAGQASEPVKILHILHSMSHNINNIRDIETKQIAFSFAYPNSMFARTTLATSKWYSFRSTS